MADQALRHGRTLTAGQDQTGQTCQVIRTQHPPPPNAEALEGDQVFLDVALDPEDTDDAL
jgi:hypothetical protein